ncbi:hypothetical protein FACS1894110_20930 [Spirochaetia bacterium]|nr:hypothetical protein FACS1894110_20930 [Spirochaetia bacterium]
MKLEKQTYFQLLEDAFVYKAHQDEIDKTLKKDAEEAKESSVCVSEVLRHLTSPKEVEISDTEYQELKKHSELLDKYEGNLLQGVCSFESYREKYEKEVQKNNKLRMIVERLMKGDEWDMDDKVRVLLDMLL